MLELLPEEFDVLFIHPMFGLEGEAHNGWENIPFFFEKVRVVSDCNSTDEFLHMFAQKGCRMVEISSTCAATAAVAEEERLANRCVECHG
ncbi:hypothetical protein L1049_013999 [Liquidambar formosana]|uniref:Uncharacterized protein n=1 Tax=Liquidambar formosana TaxID=63359 RepID=A0AAP0RLA7_LIQFO